MKTSPRVLIFTGEGKGKTTAALGMVVRAAGHGLPALVVQFIKGDASTGELAALRLLPGVEIRQVGMGFVPKPSAPNFADHRKAAAEGLAMTAKELAAGKFRVVVLDEVCVAVAKNLLEESSVMELVKSALSDTVIVLTGRDAGPGLIDIADTVTEMRCVKHGYRAGRKAQEGVEY